MESTWPPQPRSATGVTRESWSWEGHVQYTQEREDKLGHRPRQKQPDHWVISMLVATSFFYVCATTPDSFCYLSHGLHSVDMALGKCAAKSNDLSSIPGTHIVEESDDSHKLSSDLHTHALALTHKSK